MKNYILLFAWILLIVSCEPPSEKEEIPPTPSGFGGIDGNLCFKSKSNPLEGYTVNIGGKTSTTNSLGYFLITGIPEGNQKLEVWLGTKLVYESSRNVVSDVIIPILITIPYKKGDAPDLVVVDVSQESGWDYWIVGKDEYFFINEENSLPKLVFYHSFKDNKDYAIVFDNKGLPDKVITEGFIFMFDNFNGNKVDFGILSPSGEIQIVRGITTDFVWPTSPKSGMYKAELVRWTGRVLGAIPCVAMGASAFVTGGFAIPLALWTCGNYLVKMAAEFYDDAGVENGFTRFIEDYKLSSKVYTCMTNVDVSSCLISLASKELQNYADYVAELEYRAADLRRMQEMINSNVPLKEIIIQPGPEGRDAWISMGSFDDCIEFYDRSPNDSLISVIHDSKNNCVKQVEKMFLQISVARIPTTSIISSAKLEIYGSASINVKDEIPTFNISEVNTYWDEETLSWSAHPETELITSVDFTKKSIRSWYSIDVTYTVQDWVSLRNDNFGFMISAGENTIYGEICSGDHPDPTKRPKLIISYY
ncbi:MAG: DNRLRE domain-containing protein [Nanobdellota archaeon]